MAMATVRLTYRICLLDLFLCEVGREDRRAMAGEARRRLYGCHIDGRCVSPSNMDAPTLCRNGARPEPASLARAVGGVVM
jgi:hypothetical protein